MFGLNLSKIFGNSLIIFCIFFIKFSFAEEHVHWIGAIQNQSDLKEESNIKDKVFDFLFGKSDIKLIRPTSLSYQDENNLFILDQDVCSPVLIDQKSASFNLIQSQDKNSYPSLVSICSGNDGKFYFTDSYLNKIFVLNPESKNIEELNSTLQLDKPTGIAFNPVTGLIHVAETGKHRILVLSMDGNIIKTIGRRGTEKGEFNFPNYLWIDKNGRLYIVDSMNFRIQIFSSNDEFITMFGEAGNSSGYMARPKGIATDSQGNIYIVDALFHAVQIFNSKGDYLYTFGKKGKGQAEFWLPSGIFIDNNDKIYVADSYNSRIQIFQYTSGIMDDN
jgi:DNA-binding beta-propeller fold protein YncE